jgi:hypothetical protein
VTRNPFYAFAAEGAISTADDLAIGMHFDANYQRQWLHSPETQDLSVRNIDGQPTANTIMLKMLDQFYTVSPLQ